MSFEHTRLLEETYELPTYQKWPLALVRGEGAYVWDVEGRRYLDLYGGHCVTLLGHNPPPVVEAICRQTQHLVFYSNVVYSPVRAEAARELAELAPEGLKKVFFCNSGTEAVETALKLARAYTGRSGVVAMRGDFHGRTLGSLAVTWGQAYRRPYRAVLPETYFVPFGELVPLKELLRRRRDIAAVILEPIQSMAGVYEAPSGYYRELRRLCDAHEVLLIFDEVQTGVGRTGTFSVSEAYGMRPDLIALAKSLGSGVPVGAVLVSERIAETVRPGDQGTTFGGGMLAMAAVAATLRMLRQGNWMARAPEIFTRIRDGLAGRVRAVRGRGCLIGVELPGPAGPVIAALRQEGVLVGGSEHPNTIRLLPPLVLSEADIELFLEAFERALARIARTEPAYAS
ncbi:MAG: aspartate aminotransferase family protein [Bacteroidetes bacterium]|nr:aspartate aminotransferase family protein [Rhodothermia bacterium]MCS7155361.1 aspartate aminotransferase family protein [Bacteroidota bacterium]MCX7907546.1 aspartate aminotransferase family protein [Bacteroidota bacterium]MDW8138540.1 aspartate aminotransferase family protein [Bacteroidota bacterium]MDW8284523.1 aspartate aminotransferase family protein [Bacteroidota bacterium]